MTDVQRQNEGWYERQREVDRLAEQHAEQLLGPEKAIFARSMGLIATCFDEATASGPVQELPAKRRLSIAIHGFNLIWSAWHEALCGRYDAASDHWRSMEETPDFLKALYTQPSLAAERFGSGKGRIDVHTARKVIRNAMNELVTGSGDRWHSEKMDGARTIQTFAHISSEAVSSALGILQENGKKVALERPGGGVVAEDSLRLAAINLAAYAIDLLLAVAVAFQDILPVDQLWEEEVKPLARDGGEMLRKELAGLSVNPGEVELIAFLRSDEIQAAILSGEAAGQ